MKISIIIPVYNVEDYLRQCIESVLLHSYKNIEILLVNDGSTDGSVEICKEYESNYSFVKLINKKNGGLSDARNVGIKQSTGDYVVFLDSDDYWGEDFLNDLVNYIKKNTNIDYIFFRNKYYYQQRDEFEERNINISRKQIKDKSGIECLDYIFKSTNNFQWYACSGLVRRNFILENKLFFQKGRVYEDTLWTPYIFLKAKCIDYYDKAVYVYRIGREGQITSTVSKNTITDSIYIASYWYKELSNYPIDNSLKMDLLKNFAIRYFYAIWFYGFLSRDEKKEIYKLLKGNNYLLNYSSTLLSKITMISCKMFGFRVTSNILVSGPDPQCVNVLK